LSSWSARVRFFGRDTVSLLVVLPIALPGIVTGIALDTAFRSVMGPLGIGKGLFSVVLRRLGGNLDVHRRARRTDPAHLDLLQPVGRV
jgi:ABC-type Fe3+ transport system permease subunit